MAVQTTYSKNIRPGVEGAIVNMEDARLISRTVETAAGIGFGKIVQQGADADGVKADLAGMTVQTLLGITVLDRSVRPETPNKFAQYESARIMREGVIWVTTADSITPADIVTVTLATGAIGKTAVAAGIVAIPGARWESTGTGLVKLRMSL